MKWNQVEFEASYGLFEQIPPCETIEIAFSGRSNVGKSSLINKIFNRKSIARVSSMPGKTTTINFFRLENVRFADLPGYGYAKVAKTEKQRWSNLISNYLHSDRDIVLVFQLIDMRHAPTKDDLQMIDYLVESETPFVIVLTKVDKLRPRQREERLAALQTELPYANQITMIVTSAETGEGMDQIHEIIEELAQEEPTLGEEPPETNQ
ncbi:ribosome biogenesis GTP-binding protein YihA/YsxC [Hydrogenoanaerobacterium sp.]|uniref:ribosome biogenesis GTP-binding protein YihA/YsxC n=1 Tax=Hydrogenoanaerobacterium sp. TaxID=2953763 RepID=UPI002896F5BD|nr:ribosome biogenesis GTP-binding protein YihA/YsxC [Hydrogenoanaerobacterium sp.]